MRLVRQLYQIISIGAIMTVAYLTPENKRLSDKYDYYDSIPDTHQGNYINLQHLGRDTSAIDFRLLNHGIGWFFPTDPNNHERDSSYEISIDLILGTTLLALFFLMTPLSGTPSIESIVATISEMSLFKGGIALLLLYGMAHSFINVAKGSTIYIAYESRDLLVVLVYISKFIRGLIFHRDQLIDNYRKIEFHESTRFEPAPLHPSDDEFDNGLPAPTI